MKIVALTLLASLVLLATGCILETPTPDNTPAIAEATPDVQKTVEAGVRGTRQVEADLEATVEARIVATLNAPLPTATPSPTATPYPSGMPYPTPTPLPTSRLTTTLTLVPTPTPITSRSSLPTPTPIHSRAVPDGEPLTFLIGKGSEITFTVEEELGRAPVRFDAVISSTSLSGVANLDGSPSVIVLDLHSLESDQSLRDRYIRDRMFPSTQTATVTVDRLPDLPQSFFDGEETTGTLEGALQIGENVTPLNFDVVARHDGDVINVLGRTSFTWEQLGLDTPVAGPVVYLAEEVRVQVLIVAYEQ